MCAATSPTMHSKHVCGTRLHVEKLGEEVLNSSVRSDLSDEHREDVLRPNPELV